MWVTLPWRIPKALNLTMKQAHRDKKIDIAQMKEQIKAPEKIQLSDEEIAKLSTYQMHSSKHW